MNRDFNHPTPTNNNLKNKGQNVQSYVHYRWQIPSPAKPYGYMVFNPLIFLKFEIS